jgi:hypothetical protein
MSADKPPAGYYRRLLPAGLAHLRLALASQPMVGVERHEGLIGPLAEYFDRQEDVHAAYYAEGLRTGAMVPVTPLAQADKPDTWAPGELFMKS